MYDFCHFSSLLLSKLQCPIKTKNCLNLKHRYLRKADLAQSIIDFKKLHFNKSASSRQKLLNQNKTGGPGTRLARSIDEPGLTANMFTAATKRTKKAGWPGP